VFKVDRVEIPAVPIGVDDGKKPNDGFDDSKIESTSASGTETVLANPGASK
jgi:hypothetical protein